MGETTPSIEGSSLERILVECRCGAVPIEPAGQALDDLYCHCDDCQAVHGAAYVPESVYRADAVAPVKDNLPHCLPHDLPHYLPHYLPHSLPHSLPHYAGGPARFGGSDDTVDG